MKTAGNFTLIILFLFSSAIGWAKDRYFSQTMETPVLINPAYAGFQQNLRADFQFRVQYPGIGAGFINIAAAADMGFPKIHSGAGLLLMNDVSGDGSISRNTINGYYAYDLMASEHAHLRIGLSAGVFQRTYQPGIFDTTNSLPAEPTPFVPDFGAGFLYYNDKYYLGLSVYHITQPDVSFVGKATDILSRKYSLQAGGFYEYGNIVLNPNFLVTSQASKLYFLGGANATLRSVTFGMALRLAGLNENSLNFLFGFAKGKIKVAYSYDLSILDGAGAFGGAHEISLVLQLSKPHDTEAKPMIGYMRNAY